MKILLSWLKDFVDIDRPVEEIAHLLTQTGLEVEEIHYVGLPVPGTQETGHWGGERPDTKIYGLDWDPDKIVVAAIEEVLPHPNADRLVLCRLDDGQQIHTVLTGAPNLFEFKGTGPLPRPIKVAYAKEGARIYDGHQAGQVLVTLKRAKIRGVESYSMVCSEKELGISDEHEGILLLDEDAPVGMPLRDYMGDAVLEIKILPNIARDTNVIGVAREIAALTGKELRRPTADIPADGDPIAGRASIEIINPDLNPRFVLGLIENVQIRPSPYEVQRRLRLAGMRPINNIVDATNYAMLELGEPLHAFDYDVLVQRAGGKVPTIITRPAQPGETLTTLDGVERKLDTFTVLVTDTAGPLSIAGVMGGAESEISSQTRNILLEGAAWNYINIKKTARTQALMSEAAYRFSRGVHPALAKEGVTRGLDLMRQWAGGVIAEGLVDNYPLPPKQPVVTFQRRDVFRWLGVDLPVDEIAAILSKLEFGVTVDGEQITAVTPEHRLDIGEGVTGVADLMEEVARIYGYHRIPETRLADELPPQLGNPILEKEEHLRDVLAALGLQEAISQRMTNRENESRRLPAGSPVDDQPYARIINPIAPEFNALRHSLLASLLGIVERNARTRQRIALFEIGPVFLVSEEGSLPDELQRVALVLTGPRALPGWQNADTAAMDFFDLKGTVEAMFAGLHIEGVTYAPVDYPSFHPGKAAKVLVGERQVGVMGELHPQVRSNYELPETPVLAADFDLAALLDLAQSLYPVSGVPDVPPVLEDIAVIVDESLPASRVEEVIRQAGGRLVTDVRLFDVYRGQQIGQGKKSLAYSLTYQDREKTLNDQDAARLRQKIVRQLGEELGAVLRS